MYIRFGPQYLVQKTSQGGREHRQASRQLAESSSAPAGTDRAGPNKRQRQVRGRSEKGVGGYRRV
eukprot:3104199-Pyramimonas_sp.AAC.1